MTMSRAKLLPQFQELIATADPPELGPGPRSNLKPLAELNRAVTAILGQAHLSTPAGALIRALILLWHDHLKEAHTLAQGVESADGSYIHGIMHRREPDYGNAKYWFRRAGRHVCFPPLSDRVAKLLEAKGETKLATKLIPRGEWDPCAFVDACEKVSRLKPGEPPVLLLREIQGIELKTFLENST